jgi:hypothetical protein
MNTNNGLGSILPIVPHFKPTKESLVGINQVAPNPTMNPLATRATFTGGERTEDIQRKFLHEAVLNMNHQSTNQNILSQPQRGLAVGNVKPTSFCT